MLLRSGGSNEDACGDVRRVSKLLLDMGQAEIICTYLC